VKMVELKLYYLFPWKNLLLLVCKVDTLLTLDLLNFTGK
jgi:hypothetical protein